MSESADSRGRAVDRAGQILCPPIEVITIGDEILSGTIVDTNSAMIAQKLGSVGLELKRMSSVGDDPEEIVRELREAAKRARAVIVTGGLGPTQDDRTASAASEVFGVPLELHQESLARLRELFGNLGLEMTPNNERQAWIPRGSRVVPNPMGTAPGFSIRHDGCLMVFLPGVPRELERMLEESVIAMVLEHCGSGFQVCSRTLKIFGLSEAKIDQMVKGALEALDGVSLASLPQYPENRLRLTVRGRDPQEVASTLERAEASLRERVGPWVYGIDQEDMETVVVRLLGQQGKVLALAESCTGGLIAHRLTNVPGASKVLNRAYVVYSPQAKQDMGVPPSLLEEHGTVSARAAEAMATAAAAGSGAHLAISTTGVAGPTGGTEEHPVGTVFMAMAAGREVWSQRFRFRGGRGNIKTMASTVALDWLRRFLLGEDPARYTVPWR
jgi:nicotinamide-nucleotide amidase